MFPNLNIWGKTYTPKNSESELYYPLIAHMLDTVAVSNILYNNWLSYRLQDYLDKQFQSREQALSYIALACGLHDIGKCNPIFQGALLSTRNNTHATKVEKLTLDDFIFPDLKNYDRSKLRERKLHRHEKLSHWILSNYEDKTEKPIKNTWLTLCVLGHHGSYDIFYKELRRRTDITTLNDFFGEKWRTEASSHIKQIELISGVTVKEAEEIQISNEATILISGLIVLADRLASNEETVQYSHLNSLQKLQKEDSVSYVKEQEKFLEKLFYQVIGASSDITEEDILGKYSPRGVQKKVPESEGLWIVMAPTGSGKTEAALLRHAKRKENLLFLLPTKSTTDAMFSRISKTYHKKQNTIATIAHGDARLNKFYNTQLGFDEDGEHSCGTGLIPSQLTNAGAKLSAPITVATIDQFVMGGLPLKWSPLRLLTIANSHVVIDEAHLLDPYQMGLTQELIYFLGQLNSRLTVLSATLPSDMKNEIIAAYTNTTSEHEETIFPSEEYHPAQNFLSLREPSSFSIIDSEEYSVSISMTETDDPIATHCEWVTAALEKHKQARIGVFVNQVERSQQISSILQQKHPDALVICLNSRMLGKHKNNIIETLLTSLNSQSGQAKRVIVVGTQLMEMSLDIDLDLITTDLCPAPSLIQRLGRVWRNKNSQNMLSRKNRADLEQMQVHIVTFLEDEKGKHHYPYPKTQLKRTQTYLEELNSLSLSFPHHIQNFVDSSYLGRDLNYLDTEDSSEQLTKLFQQMQANAKRSGIKEFLSPETETSRASMLTNSELEDDIATRLIDGVQMNLILLSDEKELQELGALPTHTDFTKLSVVQLKSASVPLSYRLQKILDDSGVQPLTLNKTIYAYAGRLPENIIYNQLTGLTENK